MKHDWDADDFASLAAPGQRGSTAWWNAYNAVARHDLVYAQIQRDDAARRKGEEAARKRREALMIKIDLIFLHATEKAVLVEHGVESVWLPRAYVRYPEGLQRGDEATFEVAGWLASKKLGVQG